MSRRLIRALAALLPALCMAAAADAAGAATVYVSNSAPVVPGGKSCAQPGFGAVQAGIEAAKGGTVDVCAGTYVEQVSITSPVKIVAVSGIGTATLAMPASPARSESSCDTKANVEEGPLVQSDEVSICTTGTVSIAGVTVQAVIPLETCANGLNGIFVGGGATLKSTSMTIDGASTSLNAYKGCQHGLALRVGSASREEVGHATLKSDTIYGYEKNGPTVTGAGSTMSIVSSTVTGEGATPYIAQNGIEVAYGGQASIKSTTVSGNECDHASCGAEATQASGVLFYQAAPGSKLSGSTVRENDMGVYYASGSATVPATPDVTILKDVLTSNRYEGAELEEGRASLVSDTINGTGRVGIDLYQYDEQLSASESSAKNIKISGQSEAAIKVESDKQPGDIPGRFVITNSTETGNGALLINESNDFEVIF
ncbi:MAG TPA: hypothetical protein VN618_03390 [Solirubrobacteraceae bacterium]|nr:hypothetical protein [Solirubrobacteraceae bacterium]